MTNSKVLFRGASALLATGALSLGVIGGAAAADFGGMKDPAGPPMEPPGKLSLSANVALTTDYVFRGASQTDENPAVQGGFDLTYGQFYLGIWGSNLDFGGAGGQDVANLEVDVYGGFKLPVGRAKLDLGVIYYAYPDAFDPGGELDYVELKAGLSGPVVRDVSGGLTVYYSPDYTGELGDTYTVEGSLSKPLGHGFSLGGALGYVDNTDGNNLIGTMNNDEYLYWNVGLSKSFHEKFSLGVTYWDTDGTGCGDVSLFQCDERVVGTLSASF